MGLFLARISRGRSIREFVLGAMIVPALMCFVWFAWAGGTAIDLELNGDAGGVIFDAANGDKIFAMTTFMLEPIATALAWGMSLLIVVLALVSMAVAPAEEITPPGPLLIVTPSAPVGIVIALVLVS